MASRELEGDEDRSPSGAGELRAGRGPRPGDDEIRRWVVETLAPYKAPTHIERWEGKLPRNASGKLLKNVLRGEGVVSFAETM